MIALKYGTVPIVRASGGLVDTVFDRDDSARYPDDRNGYIFHQLDNAAPESAMARAIGLWYSFPGRFPAAHAEGVPPRVFCTGWAGGMRQDHSWAWPGQHYVNIHDHIPQIEPARLARQVREPEPLSRPSVVQGTP